MNNQNEMPKIKVDTPSQIAIEETMRNLADYVSSLNMKTDITLYLHFEALINALFESKTNNSDILLNLHYSPSKDIIRPKYKLIDGELVLEDISKD